MMKFSRILRKTPAIFSTDKNTIEFKAPKSWKELSQVQLRYVLSLLATQPDQTTVRTYMFFRFCGIHIIKKNRFGFQCFTRTKFGRKIPLLLQPWQVEDLCRQFGFIDSYDEMGVRLESINGLKAVDTRLHGVRFADYLEAEKYYQAYNAQNDDRFLEKLALVLYRKRKGKKADSIKLDKAEKLGVFLWYSYIKAQLAKAFPNFFKRSSGNGDFNMLEAVNTQIRALTDGDVTKEQIILDTDCWRALTELDAKAREAKEMKEMMKKNKSK